MNAIHINWTKPSGGSPPEDFELLTTIISALKWREKNGSIGLVTDNAGAEYYRRNGIDIIWDRGVDSCLDDIVKGINPIMFWAAGKIFALMRCSAPIAVLDTDFIIWDEISADTFKDAAVIHKEELYSDVYPDAEFFNMKQGYVFDSSFRWDVKACNTAFYIIKNQEFLDFYTSEAIKFMRSTADTDDTLKYMVFAEQRLFGMCADKMGIEVETLSDLDALFGGNRYTHIWGMKQQMRDMPALRDAFCRRCIDRILCDYPYMKKVMRGIDCFKQYFE